MPPKKAAARPAAQQILPASEPEPATRETSSGVRKPWIRRTPIEVVLEQIGRQEKRVAEMREEVAKEERELQKLQQAKKVLEAI